jgi:UDP-3-O-[3-hydroxymyristoyl] glucosamine N-acyltransferase
MAKGPDRPGVKIWGNCNVYDSADIGEGTQVGAFSEIGENVVIGKNVRIGAMCFIPEGVTIEDGAWIGPRVTFSNDMYPPSSREHWLPTLVKSGARIGAGACIRPGVVLERGVLIGMGAVVTRNVTGGTWVGVPAKQMEVV